jgi:hypothetical protein
VKGQEAGGRGAGCRVQGAGGRGQGAGKKKIFPNHQSPVSSHQSPVTPYLGSRKRVAKFCDRVGDKARALRIAAIKKA